MPKQKRSNKTDKATPGGNKIKKILAFAKVLSEMVKLITVIYKLVEIVSTWFG